MLTMNIYRINNGYHISYFLHTKVEKYNSLTGINYFSMLQKRQTLL